jgi:hypothetical protein
VRTVIQQEALTKSFVVPLASSAKFPSTSSSSVLHSSKIVALYITLVSAAEHQLIEGLEALTGLFPIAEPDTFSTAPCSFMANLWIVVGALE